MAFPRGGISRLRDAHSPSGRVPSRVPARDWPGSIYSRRRAGCFFARHHPLHDATRALRGGIDGKPDTPGVRPSPGDLLDALENLLVLIEGDTEIRVQALVDIGVANGEIPDMKPVVDADIAIDRRDEMTGEDPQARVAVFGIGDG